MTGVPDATPRPIAAMDDLTVRTFEHLVALSGRALAAVEADDADELDRILRERGTLMSEAERRAETTSGSMAGDVKAGGPAGELLKLAMTLKKADERLGLAIASKRDDMARQLEAFESGGTARSAYNAAGSAGRRINIVR